MSFNGKIKVISSILVLMLFCFCEAQESSAQQKVLVEYFFQPGCRECELIKNFVLPRIEERFAGHYELKNIDINVKDNFLKLAEYQETLSIKGNEPVTMIVDSQIALSGYKEIEARLIGTIDAQLSELMSQVHPFISSKNKEFNPANKNELLKKRADKMLLAAIISAVYIGDVPSYVIYDQHYTYDKLSKKPLKCIFYTIYLQIAPLWFIMASILQYCISAKTSNN
jgi:hypothetical protein